MTRIVKKLIFIFVLLILAGCSAAPGGESAGEFLDSSTSTAKIKADLIDQLGTQAFSIQVKTFKENVQLSGFVNSQYVKKRAGVIAGNRYEIRHVRNDLIVK